MLSVPPPSLDDHWFRNAVSQKPSSSAAPPANIPLAPSSSMNSSPVRLMCRETNSLVVDASGPGRRPLERAVCTR